jgi:hypothetical protein
MWSKLWNDPVWSKVIAGVILALGATIATYFLEWWPSFGRWGSQGYAFAIASTPTPHWLLLLLGLLALPTLFLAVAIAWASIFPAKAQAPSWRDYTTDIYFGLRWRWRYSSDGGIYDAHTFCPHCDFQVFPQDVSSYRVIDHIAFRCDSCGRHLAEFQESFASVENKTKRFIQQRIRNGTWSAQQAA